MTMENKVILVTGASSGIGRATAQAFLKAGATVVFAARRLDALQKAAAGADASKVLCVACDVSDPASVDALYAQIKEKYGRLDVVFNNAGISAPSAPIDEVSVEDWLQVININLNGAFLIARGAFAMMRHQDPQGGRIINNGSISADVPRIGSVAYTASKHAVSGITKTLSLDGRAFDIACSQIDIGNAASEITANFDKGLPQADGSMRPEPVIDVVHVADAVVNMASLPLSANVQFMTIMATKMPYIGRG
ncbi:MAG: SDR family oxidoreductase [Roseibium sp.]